MSAVREIGCNIPFLTELKNSWGQSTINIMSLRDSILFAARNSHVDSCLLLDRAPDSELLTPDYGFCALCDFCNLTA